MAGDWSPHLKKSWAADNSGSVHHMCDLPVPERLQWVCANIEAPDPRTQRRVMLQGSMLGQISQAHAARRRPLWTSGGTRSHSQPLCACGVASHHPMCPNLDAAWGRTWTCASFSGPPGQRSTNVRVQPPSPSESLTVLSAILRSVLPAPIVTTTLSRLPFFLEHSTILSDPKRPQQ
jgi:hypothetical protein